MERTKDGGIVLDKSEREEVGYLLFGLLVGNKIGAATGEGVPPGECKILMEVAALLIGKMGFNPDELEEVVGRKRQSEVVRMLDKIRELVTMLSKGQGQGQEQAEAPTMRIIMPQDSDKDIKDLVEEFVKAHGGDTAQVVILDLDDDSTPSA